MRTIVHGPAGSGKTRNSAALLKHFRHCAVIDGLREEGGFFRDDNGRRYVLIPDDVLILMQMNREQCVEFLMRHGMYANIVSIQAALDLIGAE